LPVFNIKQLILKNTEMSSGLSVELKKAVCRYIDACSAAQLSTTSDDYCDAREDVEQRMMCGDGLSEEGWTAEERDLCMQLLEADARVNPDVRERIDCFFVVADASLFETATHVFGKQYDMLGAMLQYADGIENLLSIVLLCAKLNIQPFGLQDVCKHMRDIVECNFADFEDAEQELVRTWHKTMCKAEIGQPNCANCANCANNKNSSI
jgi:hypothetical protein